VWVQLKTVKNLEVGGKMRTYRPGDWVDVGKQLGLRWISQGDAWIPKLDVAEFMDTTDTGIFCVPAEGVSENAAEAALSAYAQQLSVVVGGAGHDVLRWPKTMLWDGQVSLRPELLPIGFHLLDTWQVACPLCSYEALAGDVGTDEDKARTQALIHDLRVPLYHPGLVFVQRCTETQYLIDVWQEERVESGDRFHSFLRALYRAKPLILALPVSWLDRAEMMGGEKE